MRSSSPPPQRSIRRYNVRVVSSIEPSAVRDVYVLVRRGDDVLLLLREGTGYRDGEWGPPAGKVEQGETYREAGVRELREETGLVVEQEDLSLVHLVDRSPEPGELWHWIGAFFEFSGTTGPAINREPTKARDIAWHGVTNLPSPTIDYVKHVLTFVAVGIGCSEWPPPPP